MKASWRAPGRLIAIDGVNGVAVRSTARAEIKRVAQAQRGGISTWDASGVFGDLIVADPEAGRPSARTLLLLYAADLAFRLRWEIRPAIVEGRTVAAAPYVATAIAFGRAAGVSGGWLRNLFAFAMKPDELRLVDKPPARTPHAISFVDFGCAHLSANGHSLSRRELAERARTHLRISARL